MRSRVWLGFATLCLFAGSRWLVETAVPSLLPSGPRMAIHAGLLAASLITVALLRRLDWGVWDITAGLGVLVFGLPAVIVTWASGRVAGLTEELVFLLLPMVVVLVIAQKGSFGREDDVRGLLGPALAGLAGAALLVPFSLPASILGKLLLAALIVSVVLAGWATVRLHRTLQGFPVVSASAVIASAWALLAIFSPGWHWVGGLTPAEWVLEAAQALLLDGPILLLGVWCLRELAPIQFSARVLVILLVAIVESFVAARPVLTWTMSAGALLMATGAGWLLYRGDAAAE